MKIVYDNDIIEKQLQPLINKVIENIDNALSELECVTDPTGRLQEWGFYDFKNDMYDLKEEANQYANMVSDLNGKYKLAMEKLSDETNGIDVETIKHREEVVKSN